MDNLQFILSLKDLLSPAMHQAASVADTEAGRIATDMNKVGVSAENAGSKFSGLKNIIGGILGGVGISTAIFGIERMIDVGIEKAHHLHEAEAALTNTMKNQGTYTKEAFEEAVKSAGDFAKNVLYSRSEIIGLQSQLRLVGNISETEMQRMTKASADMATKFHLGIEDAGNAIAKAVNNPEMLRRLGMQLKIDPAIQEHLQNLAKHGKEAQARLELLTIVEQKVGGAAQAAFDADPMARYNKIVGSLQIQMGNAAIKIQAALAPALEKLATIFTKLVEGIASAVTWMAENKTAMEIIAVVATGLTLAIYGQSMAMGIVAAATKLWAGAQELLNIIMEANPIILIITVIIALGLWIYSLTKKYEGWGNAMKAVWNIAKEFVNLNIIIWKAFGEQVWYWVQFAWLKFEGFVQWIGGAIHNVWNSFNELVHFNFSAAKDALFKEIITPASQELDNLQKRHLTNQSDYAKAVGSSLENIQKNWNNVSLTKIATSSATTNPISQNSAAINKDQFKGLKDDAGKSKSKADSINSGGQRSIVINIAKQTGAENIYVGSNKEGANEMESLVREAMRRVLLSINGNAVSAS